MSEAVSAGIVTSAILLKPISQFILKALSDPLFWNSGHLSRIDCIFCTIWFFTTWVDCERSGADGRTAEVLGILTELAAVTSNEWDVRALDRYLLQFYLDRSRNREVSWYHLNQISNLTVHTIRVTGLENLYRKDDKYVSKGNVLFNLQHILISIDCHSTHFAAKSCCHPMIGIVRLPSIDSWMSMKESLWIYERIG